MARESRGLGQAGAPGRLGALGAAGVVRAWLPGLAAPAERLPALARAAAAGGSRVLSPWAVRVRAAGGRRAVLVSGVPLAGRDGRPADLALTERGGGLGPASAPFSLALGARADGGLRVGPSPGLAVGVTPVGAAASPGMPLGGGLVYPDVHEDADVVARPTLAGAETFDVLRSPAAPGELAWRLDLPDGASARADAGGVRVTRGGLLLARMLAPWAADAAGRRVEVAWRLDGDTVRLGVAHRAAGVSYPVVVDPEWESGYDFDVPGAGAEGWARDPEPDGPSYSAFVATGPGTGGLWIVPKPGPHPVMSNAKLFFTAPGTTTITAIDWLGMEHFNDLDGQALRLELRRQGGMLAAQQDWFLPGPHSEPVVSQQDPQGSKFALMWLHTAVGSVVKAGSLSHGRVHGAAITLTDGDYPSVKASGALRDLEGKWSAADGSEPLSIHAEDAGTGVEHIRATATDANGEHVVLDQPVPCDPDHKTPGQGSRPCPAQASTPPAPLGGPLPEGHVTLAASAVDGAGNDSDDGATSDRWEAWIDRTAPAQDTTSELRSIEGRWSSPRPGAEAVLKATDAGSGVQGQSLEVRDKGGSLVSSETADACPAPGPVQAPCPKVHHAAIAPGALPEGEADFAATASDHAGNQAQPVTWRAWIDRRPPAARADGPLEELAREGWSDTRGTLAVNLEGQDPGAGDGTASGVATLSLLATGADGQEREIASRETCDPEALQPGEACPAHAAASVGVPAASLPDGKTQFRVIATDAAGNVTPAGESWQALLDRQPPSAPPGLQAKAWARTLLIDWDQPPDTGGSGIAGYEYAVSAPGAAVIWHAATESQAAAPIPYAAPGQQQALQILVRAVDRAGNTGPPSRLGHITATAAGNGTRLQIATYNIAGNPRWRGHTDSKDDLSKKGLAKISLGLVAGLVKDPGESYEAVIGLQEACGTQLPAIARLAGWQDKKREVSQAPAKKGLARCTIYGPALLSTLPLTRAQKCSLEHRSNGTPSCAPARVATVKDPRARRGHRQAWLASSGGQGEDRQLLAATVTMNAGEQVRVFVIHADQDKAETEAAMHKIQADHYAREIIMGDFNSTPKTPADPHAEHPVPMMRHYYKRYAEADQDPRADMDGDGRPDGRGAASCPCGRETAYGWDQVGKGRDGKPVMGWAAHGKKDYIFVSGALHLMPLSAAERVPGEWNVGGHRSDHLPLLAQAAVSPEIFKAPGSWASGLGAGW